MLRAIDEFDGQPQTVVTLKLMALLFPRPGELRMAEWPEFDFEKCVWTIPAAKTKMRREHRVYLAAQAMVILIKLHEYWSHVGYAFPGFIGNDTKPLCENTLNTALRRVG